jgi:dihydromonapterin reductase/dihydrofolate reductase
MSISKLSPVVITGASSRIGFAIAESLFEAGYPVVAVYRENLGRLKGLPGVDAVQADLSTKDGVESLIQHVIARYTSLRGVIHNASVWLDDSAVNFCYMRALHVEAPQRLNDAFAHLLKSPNTSGHSDIIHITDDSALRGTSRHVDYAKTKQAMSALTLSFAKALAPEVHVNEIAPGFILAPEGSTPEQIEAARAKALIHKEPGPSAIADAVRFILGNTYMTGSTVTINGGRHLK